MTQQKSNAERLVGRLADLGVIPEEVIKEDGTAAVLNRIQRLFDNAARQEYINPDIQVGKLLKQCREEFGDRIPQEELRQAINNKLKQVGAIEITLANQSSISRLENGTQSLTYLHALAIAQIYKVAPDAFSPWGKLDDKPGDALRNAIEFGEEFYSEFTPEARLAWARLLRVFEEALAERRYSIY